MEICSLYLRPRCRCQYNRSIRPFSLSLHIYKKERLAFPWRKRDRTAHLNDSGSSGIGNLCFRALRNSASEPAPSHGKCPGFLIELNHKQPPNHDSQIPRSQYPFTFVSHANAEEDARHLDYKKEKKNIYPLAINWH